MLLQSAVERKFEVIGEARNQFVSLNGILFPFIVFGISACPESAEVCFRPWAGKFCGFALQHFLLRTSRAALGSVWFGLFSGHFFKHEFRM